MDVQYNARTSKFTKMFAFQLRIQIFSSLWAYQLNLVLIFYSKNGKARETQSPACYFFEGVLEPNGLIELHACIRWFQQRSETLTDVLRFWRESLTNSITYTTTVYSWLRKIFLLPDSTRLIWTSLCFVMYFLYLLYSFEANQKFAWRQINPHVP